jgi:hypothetical protein
MTSQKTTADNPWVFIEQITTFQKIDTEGVNTIQKFTKKEQETAATDARFVIQYTLHYKANASNIGPGMPAYPHRTDVHDRILASPNFLKDFPTRSIGKHTKQKKKKKVASTTASSKKRPRDVTTDAGGIQSVDT